jgi:hypothetical protein
MMTQVRRMKWMPLVALVAFAPSLAVAQFGGRAQNAGRGQAFVVDGAGQVVQGGSGATTGSFRIVQFFVENGQLWGAGVFNGTVNGEAVSTAGRVLVDTTGGTNAVGTGTLSQGQAACDILTLVLGPLHLDLLGLVIDLNQVELEITAVPGAGNLLGNLLCAVAGLLDPGPSPIAALLGQIAALLNGILAILG